MRSIALPVLTFLAVAAAALAVWAQDSGREACVEVCREEHAQCVESCGSHGNPMECESECRRALQDCSHDCRQ